MGAFSYSVGGQVFPNRFRSDFDPISIRRRSAAKISRDVPDDWGYQVRLSHLPPTPHLTVRQDWGYHVRLPMRKGGRHFPIFSQPPPPMVNLLPQRVPTPAPSQQRRRPPPQNPTKRALRQQNCGAPGHTRVLCGVFRGHLTCTNKRAQADEQKITRNERFLALPAMHLLCMCSMLVKSYVFSFAKTVREKTAFLHFPWNFLHFRER